MILILCDSFPLAQGAPHGGGHHCRRASANWSSWADHLPGASGLGDHKLRCCERLRETCETTWNSCTDGQKVGIPTCHVEDWFVCYGHPWPNFHGTDIHSLQPWATAPCCLCCHVALSCSLASDHLLTGENLLHTNIRIPWWRSKNTKDHKWS